MKSLHVGAAQIHSGGGIEDVLARVERQVKAAAAVGVDVLLFSECALSSYDYGWTREQVHTIAQPVTSSACDRIVAMATTYRVALLIGFVERDGEHVYNSHLVARPDGQRDIERKHALTGGELKAGFTAGEATRKIFVFNGVRTAIIICADGGIKGLYDRLRDQHVAYRFCPTGGGGKMNDMLRESDLLTEAGRNAYAANRPRVFKTEAFTDAEELHGIGFTSTNALGPAGTETCHQGHCMIVDRLGVMRAQIPGTIVLEHQQDQMIHAELTFPDE